MILQLNDDGVVSSVNEEDLIYVDKNELEQLVESYHKLENENEQLYELINFANTLIAFKTSESCQKEWEKRLKELKE